MCGRYTLRNPQAHPIIALAAMQSPLPRHNIAPSDSILIAVHRRGETRIEGQAAVFGFLPGWAKPEARPQINARAETVAEKPFFRDAFRFNRCLVPADGWYEWKMTGARKIPYFIRRPDDQGFFFAGLYSKRWQPGSGASYSYCIITTEASPDLAHIHDRMPVIVPEPFWRAWLDDEMSEDRLREIMTPAPAGMFEAYPVSTFVNRPANEGPECIRPSRPEPDPETDSGPD